MRVALGSDHGGFDTKESVKALLLTSGIEVIDLGCLSHESVDYPDYAREVAARVVAGEVDQGVLICTTGIGMSIAANRFPGVRAALCLTPAMATAARTHNNANVLVLAGKNLLTPESTSLIVKEWLKHSTGNPPAVAERHARRLVKVDRFAMDSNELAVLQQEDPELHKALLLEAARQQDVVNLIASENYASRAVRQAQGSLLANKYAEGYPGKRWYNGCIPSDMAEQLAIDRACSLFGAEHANVQPHCGSAANMAVYFAMLQPGDTILAMSLAHGGHLTHGQPANFSGRLFRIVSYGVNRTNERIDFDEVARLAAENKPKLIVAGASAYPRALDFARFREIADSCGALFMADMAHIAGLVAAGCHASPVPYAQFVTTTTHKTLRGPRSGMVLCSAQYAADLDRQVFPGLQGGPFMHTIAAKAVCFREAHSPAFKEYGKQVLANAQAMAGPLVSAGFRLVAGGTDNHLMLVDVGKKNLTGKDSAIALEAAGIIVNKNAIPFDERSPFVTSGIRIGTPAITTRGMKEAEATEIGRIIATVLGNMTNEKVIAQSRARVAELVARFPVP